MTHGEAAHERGTHNMFTGYRPSPALQLPEHGQRRQPRVRPAEQPAAVRLHPEHAERVRRQRLPAARRSRPFSLGSDPANGGFQVQDLNLPGGVDDDAVRHAAARCSTRSTTTSPSKEKADNVAAMDTFYERAYSLISSQKAREAFNIDAEPAALRDEYGRNAAGQRMLMARRLVEAGVRFVSLTYGGWDMHASITGGMRGQMPPFDQAFAALIRDLDRAGLLDTTLVMVSQRVRPHAEDQRRRPAATTGRRCSASCWPAAASRRARSTARRTRPPASRRTTRSAVEDLATTVYHRLGIDADKELMAPGDRPIEIVDGGKVRQGAAGVSDHRSRVGHLVPARVRNGAPLRGESARDWLVAILAAEPRCSCSHAERGTRPSLLRSHLCAAHSLSLPALAVLLLAASASPPSPRWARSSPRGGQRGTEVDVTFSGGRLADAQEILFYYARHHRHEARGRQRRPR